MNRIILALSLSILFLTGCGGTVQPVESYHPTLPGYTLPPDTDRHTFWAEKQDFWSKTLKRYRDGEMSDAEKEIVNHAFDYKNLFEQLNEQVEQHNFDAEKSNVENGYTVPGVQKGLL